MIIETFCCAVAPPHARHSPLETIAVLISASPPRTHGSLEHGVAIEGVHAVSLTHARVAPRHHTLASRTNDQLRDLKTVPGWHRNHLPNLR